MKKIITLVLTVAVITVMSIVPSFATVVHTSMDQVTTHDPSANQYVHKSDVDLGKHGQNDPLTDLGDISDMKLGLIVVYGWTASTEKIESFGYQVNDDEPVTGIPKFYNGDPERQEDNATIEGQAAGLGYPDGESVRFRYEIPVQVGEDIEIRLFLTDATGEEVDLGWTIMYTNSYQPTAEESTPCDVNTLGGNTTGGDAEGGDSEGGESTGGNTEGGNTTGGNTTGGNTSGGAANAGTADGYSVIFMIAAAAMVVTVVMKKRVIG